MCLILLAHKAHPHYPLVVAANRDEQYARPTATAAFWEDNPNIYGGRDLEQKGTWLGITRSGRIAAVTNFRDSYTKSKTLRSRGSLVSNFLRANQASAQYVKDIARDAALYNGFSLIAGDLEQLYYYSNRGGHKAVIAPGVHGLSNHLLNTPWPKVEHGKKVLTALLERQSQALTDGLFELLSDRTPKGELYASSTSSDEYPTHLSSPAFIVSPNFGTRSSTVILIDNHGQVTFVERTFGEQGKPGKAITARFALESIPSATTI